MYTQQEDLENRVKSLIETFQTIPDPRRNNKSRPLPAILALVTAAMLRGAKSLYAIFQWEELPGVRLLAAYTPQSGLRSNERTLLDRLTAIVSYNRLRYNIRLKHTVPVNPPDN